MKLPMIALMFAILLTGCDKLPINKGETAQNDVAKSIEQENVENQDTDIETLEAKFKEEQEKFSQEFGEIEPVSYNPCVDSELVNGVKQGIKDEAMEILRSRAGADIATSLTEFIYGSDISFGNIYENNGYCVATATVAYFGGENSEDNLSNRVVQFINDNSFGGGHVKKLESLGMSQFNLDEISDLSGNSFSGTISYQTKEFLNERGEQQIGWQARWGVVPNMLAVIGRYDLLLQEIEADKIAKEKESQERQEQFNKRRIENRDFELRNRISSHISRYWNPPANSDGKSIKVDITFTPDGEIIKHKIHSNDEAVIQSLQELLSKRIRMNNLTPKLTENRTITLNLHPKNLDSE